MKIIFLVLHISMLLHGKFMLLMMLFKIISLIRIFVLFFSKTS